MSSYVSLGAENAGKIGAIGARLRRQGVGMKANDSLGDYLTDEDRRTIENSVRQCVDSLLAALLIDSSTDHNTRDTARRMARMFMETFAGRFTAPPAMTDFPNALNLDELYIVGPVTVRSTCAHHFCPITGRAWYGVIPDGKVIGLSKFARLTEWIFARPQIQEEAVVQLADLIEEATKPRGLAVVVKANHSCVTWRGVKDVDGTMVTNVMRGLLKDSHAARAEFLTMISQRLGQ